MDTNKKTPVYKQLKNFPGANTQKDTIFYHQEHGGPKGMITTKDGSFCTAWDRKEYFEPFVGEFFEKLNEEYHAKLDKED